MSKPSILGLHIRQTKNVGDRHCHPLDYFNFKDLGFKQESGDYRYIPEDQQADVIVLGGGAIAAEAQRVRARFPNSFLLAWGIGATKRERTKVSVGDHLKASKGYATWGSRDMLMGVDYAPCVSCMNEVFTNIPEPTHDVVVFGHAGLMPLNEEARRLDVPYVSNTFSNNITEIVSYLASGRTIVTSSYHGMYWGTLLGRKVAVIPFGSKFFNTRYKAPFVESIEEGIAAAQAFPDSLDFHRSRTLRFEQRLRGLLASYSSAWYHGRIEGAPQQGQIENASQQGQIAQAGSPMPAISVDHQEPLALPSGEIVRTS